MSLAHAVRQTLSPLRRQFGWRLSLGKARAGCEIPALVTAIDAALGPPAAEARAAWRRIEDRRATLLASDQSVPDVDFGAGYSDDLRDADTQAGGVASTLRVAEAASWSKDPASGQLFFHLIRALRPQRCLELGSCVGVSGSYIGSALALNRTGRLWTVEGSPGVASIARATYATLGLSEVVTLEEGPFAKRLPDVLPRGPFDFAFIDGHHDGDATLAYFETLKPALAPRALIAFDDVAWSDSMAAAWSAIRQDPAVAKTSEVAGVGFALLR